jgi:hypothetical protein
MNMYLFFKNLNILCIFSDRFFFWFFPGSGSVPVFGVNRFNDRFGSGNIDSKCQTSGFVHHSSSCFLQQQSKNFATTVMAQSSRAVGRGQKKGRDFPTNAVPPPSFSIHFQQGQLVFHLLEVGLQQQVQRLKNMFF